MQDAQDDRSKLCLNYVTKEPNAIANISRKFFAVFYILFVRYYVLKKQNKDS